jgi:hypothetical protein
LDGRDWNEADKYLANAGLGTKSVTYSIQPGKYGTFTDAYNTKKGVINSDSQEVPEKLEIIFPSVQPPVDYYIPESIVAGRMVPSEATTCRPIHQ